MIALPAWLFSAGASLGKFYIKGETLNQTLSKKSLLFLVHSWDQIMRDCSLFIHFFPTRPHLVLPTFAFFPIKAKGCDSDIFLAVPDILSLLRNDLSITEPCLDAYVAGRGL